MEKDDEVKGSGNHYTTHYRLLDTRLGKWFSTDPVTKEDKTPYEVNSNKPITNNDPDGDCDDCNTSANLTLKINLGSHNNSIGLSASVTQTIGNVKMSAGIGSTYFGSFNKTGVNGIGLRGSLKGGFDNGTTSVTLGTNYFKGVGKMKEFNQRTGIATIQTGKFSISYENDGTPFAMNDEGKRYLADGKDRFRTAAVQVNYGELGGRV